MSDAAWNDAKLGLPPGTRLRGIVTRHCPFGIFVEIPGLPFPGLVEIIDFKDSGKTSPSDYPSVGSEVVAVVLGFRESNHQIGLGMKPSQLGKTHVAEE